MLGSTCVCVGGGHICSVYVVDWTKTERDGGGGRGGEGGSIMAVERRGGAGPGRVTHLNADVTAHLSALTFPCFYSLVSKKEMKAIITPPQRSAPHRVSMFCTQRDPLGSVQRSKRRQVTAKGDI